MLYWFGWSENEGLIPGGDFNRIQLYRLDHIAYSNSSWLTRQIPIFV